MNFKRFKGIIILLFIISTGLFYSCNNKDDLIPLEDVDSNMNDDLDHDENSSKEDIPGEDSSVIDGESSHEREDKLIYVHICGAINKPDVYELKENTRLFELVKSAGGFTKDAADDYINLASIVMDGEQVYIPTKEEAKELDLPSPISKPEEKGSKKININTASKEELMTLTGIGEAKAKSIIEYRQSNGNFKTIEDIKKISGIKDSIYTKISDLITVE